MLTNLFTGHVYNTNGLVPKNLTAEEQSEILQPKEDASTNPADLDAPRQVTILEVNMIKDLVVTTSGFVYDMIQFMETCSYVGKSEQPNIDPEFIQPKSETIAEEETVSTETTVIEEKAEEKTDQTYKLGQAKPNPTRESEAIQNYATSTVTQDLLHLMNRPVEKLLSDENTTKEEFDQNFNKIISSFMNLGYDRSEIVEAITHHEGMVKRIVNSYITTQINM